MRFPIEPEGTNSALAGRAVDVQYSAVRAHTGVSKAGGAVNSLHVAGSEVVKNATSLTAHVQAMLQPPPPAL